MSHLKVLFTASTHRTLLSP